jgi:hypothetical protein
MAPIAALSAAVVASLALGAATAARPVMMDQTAPTSLLLYSPFTGGGNVASDIRIARAAAGKCWTTSSSTGRSDAFRCIVGNLIYDPCFAPSTGLAGFVLCPLSPLRSVLRIKLTDRLPATTRSGSGDPMHGLPWTVRLGDGKWCRFINGVTGLVAGMRINYGCSGGGILIGTPRRSSRTWTMLYSESAQTSRFRTVPVAAAWW